MSRTMQQYQNMSKALEFKFLEPDIEELPGDSSLFPMVSKLQLDDELDIIQHEIILYHQYWNDADRYRRHQHQRNLLLIRERRQARINALYY